MKRLLIFRPLESLGSKASLRSGKEKADWTREDQVAVRVPSIWPVVGYWSRVQITGETRYPDRTSQTVHF